MEKKLEQDKRKKLCKKKIASKNKQDKDKYFAYYDDVKDGTHKVVDW